MALATKGKKKADKKGPKGGDKKKLGGEQRREMSKVKCFACHKFGHYAVQCPNKKKKKVVAFVNMEEFASKFGREFSLIACMSSCLGTSRVWYIDSGSSTHMFDVRECFFELKDRGVDVQVELGDDRIIRVVGRATLSFQRESHPPLRFQDVYYLGLRKNLISISTTEDRGFEVHF